MKVLSLCDHTGIMVKPWADAGHECYCVDIQKAEDEDNIHHIQADVNKFFPDFAPSIVFAFPPCTHTAVSGATHFKSKGPQAAVEAFTLLSSCLRIIDRYKSPYMVENPVSTFSTYWRKPEYIFDPFEYGGYLPEDDQHPDWPEHIAPRDAYPKRTCLWTGNGFVMPEKNPVIPEAGYSRQHKKLGGKSDKTKNIRSATPRGFSIAVFEHNRGELK
ncbi:MAG: Dcm methylase [PVC group bacterium]|nr:Dcm methylase [PVC group bacterium]